MNSPYSLDYGALPPAKRRGGIWIFAILAFILLVGARYIASTIIDYSWWMELHQTDTWYQLLLYGTVPVICAAILYFVLFYSAFRLGIKSSGSVRLAGIWSNSLLTRGAVLLLALLAILAANSTVSNWTVVRFFGSLQIGRQPAEFIDPIFGRPLHFYFFDLPMYQTLLRVLLTGAILTTIVYWVAAHADDFRRRLPRAGETITFDFERLSFAQLLDSGFVRGLAAVALFALSAHFYLARYDLLLEEHGSYLTGVDWTADHLSLPLQWMLISGACVAGLLILLRQGRFVWLLLLLLPVRYVLPALVSGVYVRPNELALEKPYIQHHIEATRAAYGLQTRVKEETLNARPEVPIQYAKYESTLDNVRLWDWRAFHDTVSQIQPLRPYVYTETDVDRYTIDGKLRQVLVSPRELDIRQLGDARNRWINPHLIYTHGYGIVMAEANRITADGLPVLFIQDAPPVVNTPSLHFTKPEIYFSEVAHEPVFVDTKQQEFNYPAGSEQSVSTTYKGTGGFDLSFLNRVAAATAYGDPNILITGYLTGSSRMMIRRSIRERLAMLAGFITWDEDPYLVVTEAGRLVWMVDGYTSSDAHPYSRALELPSGQSLNYMRNSVKATVDAYDGSTNLYVFDRSDVLIEAYSRLLPHLFKPASAMPGGLRAHVRYPETLFNVQAEIYRTFHMRDAESFYNRADLWDLTRTGTRQGEGGAGFAQATYVVASLPGETKPEFMLITPFTPANKNNLIGFMAARCDGEHLGELVFEQLAKQVIVYGPMQIDARINQDQTISKDLTLWSQQGSQVLRGQTLVLPIENSFLYVEPIYIQASQASMPELKKVALAMGNLLTYADTYEQALTELIKLSKGSGGPPMEGTVPLETTTAGPTSTAADNSASNAPAVAATTPESNRTLEQVRDHLDRYRQFSAQGKWAEAGRELDEIQRLVRK